MLENCLLLFDVFNGWQLQYIHSCTAVLGSTEQGRASKMIVRGDLDSRDCTGSCFVCRSRRRRPDRAMETMASGTGKEAFFVIWLLFFHMLQIMVFTW